MAPILMEPICVIGCCTERVRPLACLGANGQRFHDLRHAFATTYLNKRGDNWKRAMELMGHGDIRTTLLYIHVVHDPARDAKDADALKERRHALRSWQGSQR